MIFLKQKGFAPIIILALVLAVFLAGGFVYYLKQVKTKDVMIQSQSSINNLSKSISPEEQIREFYKGYIEIGVNLGKPGVGDIKSYLKNSPYYSQELQNNLDKTDSDFKKQCGDSPNCSHGDLIICAQDFPDMGVTTKKISEDTTSAIILANLKYSGGSIVKPKVTLKKIGTSWKIVNIECPSK